MLAEFSINPVDSEHPTGDAARVDEELQASGLEYRTGPIGVCVEGEPEQVLAAVCRCHQAVAARHGRVITTVMIDDRRPPHPAVGAERQTGRRVPQADMDAVC
jgi:uncharacterized protein YqgV (UPF0045/DUF77 family)